MFTRATRPLGLTLLCVALAACFAGPSSTDPGGAAPPKAPDADAGGVAPGAPRGPLNAMERGLALVQSNGCASCHQSGDPKDGALSGRAKPLRGTVYPPNLTPDKETGLGDWTEEEIVRAIREGKDDQMSDLCSVMPRFADLSYAQASDIVAYLRGLPPVRHKLPASQCDDAPGEGGASGDAGSEVADDAGGGDAAQTGPDAQPATDAGATCPGFAAPDTAAPCRGCGTHACQPNGCYGGYYCELGAAKCHAKPPICP